MVLLSEGSSVKQSPEDKKASVPCVMGKHIYLRGGAHIFCKIRAGARIFRGVRIFCYTGGPGFNPHWGQFFDDFFFALTCVKICQIIWQKTPIVKNSIRNRQVLRLLILTGFIYSVKSGRKCYSKDSFLLVLPPAWESWRRWCFSILCLSPRGLSTGAFYPLQSSFSRYAFLSD